MGESTPTEAEYEVLLPLVEVGVSRLDEIIYSHAQPFFDVIFFNNTLYLSVGALGPPTYHRAKRVR